jgi:opacity protein-like surface antigen
MKANLRASLCACALLAIGTTPALAIGPVDGEIGAVYWANDFETAGASADAGAPGFHAELWLKDFGLRATRFSSEPDVAQAGVENSDYTSVDLMWKAFAPTENNYVAVGLGWEDVDLATIGLDGSTSGARVAVEGRVGFVGAVYGYAQAAYLPQLDDANSVVAGLTFEEMEGLEYELGVQWKMLPFMSMRAGYRANNVDYKLVDGLGGEESDTVESTGFLAGLGFHF